MTSSTEDGGDSLSSSSPISITIFKYDSRTKHQLQKNDAAALQSMLAAIEAMEKRYFPKNESMAATLATEINRPQNTLLIAVLDNNNNNNNKNAVSKPPTANANENANAKKSNKTPTTTTTNAKNAKSNAFRNNSNIITTTTTASASTAVVVGYLIFSKVPSKKPPFEYLSHIWKLAVRDGEYRHRGIGSRLMREALRCITGTETPRIAAAPAIQKQASTPSSASSWTGIITLHVDTQRENAFRLYSKFGFVVVRTEQDYYEPGRHAHLMQLSII